RAFGAGRDGSGEAPGELLLQQLHQPAAQGKEISREEAGRRGKRAALRVLAADLGFDQPLTEASFGLLDADPDLPVTLAQVAGRAFDGPGPLHGLKDLGQPKAEGVAPTGFEPDLQARHQRGLLGPARRGGTWHEKVPTGLTVQTHPGL